MRSVLRLLAFPVASALLVTSTVVAAPSRIVACRDGTDDVHPLTLQVDGEPATGRYALPSQKAKALVVIAHGYGHTSASWTHHMRAMAGRGVIAVAMDYRGMQITPDDDDEDDLPEARGWPVMAGAEDLIASAKLFDRVCAPRLVVLLGVSMGGNVSGIALAEAGERGIRGRNGSPLFDHWIDVEGVVNLIESYLEARVACAAVRVGCNEAEDMEREAGGRLEEQPGAYVERTVVARIDDVRASGVRGAIVTHGVDDGLVPYNQAREISTELRLVGIPTEMRTVGLEDEDTERETTLTGHFVGRVQPGYDSPLAGHASERSTTHIVMEDALQRLWALVAGRTPANRECLVNGQVPQRVVCTP